MALAQVRGERELELGVDTGLRALWQAEQDFELELASPSLAFLTFVNPGPNTALDADLRIQTREVELRPRASSTTACCRTTSTRSRAN